jgi:hypothetical protein
VPPKTAISRNCGSPLGGQLALALVRRHADASPDLLLDDLRRAEIDELGQALAGGPGDRTDEKVPVLKGRHTCRGADPQHLRHLLAIGAK